MPSYNTDYKFSPRVREIIEQKRGIKFGMTHAQAELLIKDVLSGNYSGNYNFGDIDKSKIMFYLNDFNPNDYHKDDLEKFVDFFIKSFTKEEVTKFVTDVVKRTYHPGMVLYNVRVLNSAITYFASLFPECIEMVKGTIINKTFIGDVKKVYREVMFEDDTAKITDENVNERITEFVDNMKSVYKRKLMIHRNGDIVILASKDQVVIDDLTNIGLIVEDIPVYYFKWEKDKKRFYFL